MNFFVVSGLSGSGKTIALQALEDMGFYCIDNLPASLLTRLAEQLLGNHDPTNQTVAVGMDARNRAFLKDLPDNLERLKLLGISFRILFLDAEEATLVRRFQQTRRPHPLITADTSLIEAIRLERQLLEPLSFAADLHIDTTHKTPHELRTQVRDYASSGASGGLTLLFESFGYKRGTPLDADYVFDVRCLPNPHWQEELRPFTGLDLPVTRFLESQPEVEAMYTEIRVFLENWLPRFEREDRSYMTVALGCTGGQHRSVYLAQRLASYFQEKGFKVQLRHREIAS